MVIGIIPIRYSLLQNMLVEQRQAFMLPEHFIRSENNLKQLTLYGLLWFVSACSKFRACHGDCCKLIMMGYVAYLTAGTLLITKANH